MHTSRLRPWRQAALAALLLLLQGCGFHLRGDASLPADATPLWIDNASMTGAFRTQLPRTLKQRGIELTPEEGNAGSRLRIHDQKSDYKVLSLDGKGKVIEYELYEAFRFSLYARDGRVLVEDQQLGTSRSFGNAEDLILGKQHEQERIRAEMRSRLIDNMLRRIRQQLS